MLLLSCGLLLPGCVAIFGVGAAAALLRLDHLHPPPLSLLPLLPPLRSGRRLRGGGGAGRTRLTRIALAAAAAATVTAAATPTAAAAATATAPCAAAVAAIAVAVTAGTAVGGLSPGFAHLLLVMALRALLLQLLLPASAVAMAVAVAFVLALGFGFAFVPLCLLVDLCPVVVAVAVVSGDVRCDVGEVDDGVAQQAMELQAGHIRRLQLRRCSSGAIESTTAVAIDVEGATARCSPITGGGRQVQLQLLLLIICSRTPASHPLHLLPPARRAAAHASARWALPGGQRRLTHRRRWRRLVIELAHAQQAVLLATHSLRRAAIERCIGCGARRLQLRLRLLLR